MTASNDLVARTGDLKRELIAFVSQRRFDRPVRRALDERHGPRPVMDEEELTGFLDWLVLEMRLPDGRTVVQTFVAEHPELPDAEREMLLGWHDIVDGIFEVGRRDGEALLAVNLVDDLTYRVRSNMGSAVFRQVPRRSFFMGRLLPVTGEWVLSGNMRILPAAARDDLYRAAVELSAQFPALVFRNPEKLALGWEMQRDEHRHFIDFFGSDLVVMPGHELDARLRAYDRYRTYEARDKDGTSIADRARESRGVEPEPVEISLPDAFHSAETIGVIYDEVEGMAFYMDFGALEEVFANPELARSRRHRDVVLHFLKDDGMSPLPLRRVAERDPQRASQVFQRVLNRPRFSWERDGEALLRTHKAWFYEQPRLPTVMPISERLFHATWSKPKDDHARPDFRPTSRRKKGSWKRRG